MRAPQDASASISQLLGLQRHLVAGTQQQKLDQPSTQHRALNPPRVATESSDADDAAGVTHHEWTVLLVLAKAVTSPRDGGNGGHLPLRLWAVLPAVPPLQVLQRRLGLENTEKSFSGSLWSAGSHQRA